MLIMDDITKTTKSLKDSCILLESVTKTVKNEEKEQRREFIGMLLGTLGASLFGNMLAGKGIARAGYGTKRQGIFRAGY